MGEPNKLLEKLVEDIKLENVKNYYTIAYQTLKVLTKIISENDWTYADELIAMLRGIGRRVVEADPTETAAGNMVRRVLKIVRDEYAGAQGSHIEGDPQESLQKLLLSEGQGSDYKKIFPNLKDAILDNLSELETELETSADNIMTQSLQHIHSDEVIMTGGGSKTVEGFLKRAAKTRKFQVIVVEFAPSYSGQQLAKSLAEAGIETTLIPDSNIFAIMSRVNKVIIGTHSMMANGGLKAVSGTHPLALCAKNYSVPLIVCTAMFKLTPQYHCSYDQNAFNKFTSPEDVMSFSSSLISKVQVYAPYFDYVPPDLVSLFISNIGGNSPSYVYRLLSELYHPDDHDL